jgi:uncharacterized delta-60 repeat protein
MSGRIIRALLLPALSLLLSLGAQTARAQSALDGFDPNANGTVRVVVVQPDGKILIGGDFTTLSPNGGLATVRNRIARLNPDGTIDSAFNPNANAPVLTIAVQADGKILAGGQFNGASSIGGATRNRIARLDGTTGAADSFDPNANSDVRSIVVQSDGKILAGGDFNGANSIGGATRNRIARLDPTSGVADSFDPNADSTVYAIAAQPDGRILAGGAFNSIGGAARNRIARLDSTSGLADSFDPSASGDVRSIVLQADGKILAGGDFNGANSIGGATRNRIGRLDPTTGAADSFDPNANSTVNAIAVQSDGKILAGGAFNGANSIGGATRNRIGRLDPTTGAADSFDPNANSTVNAIAVQSDGKILAGGDFNGANSIDGATRNRIARLETDGRLDQTLNLGIGSSDFVSATAVQADGKILIGGKFSSVLSVARNNIARLNTDGTLDTLFDPNANDTVNAIAVQADGKILAGGDFSGLNCIGGQTRNRIARLDAVTGAADSFDPNADFSVNAIAVQADGKILVGGDFSGLNSIGGATRNRIARLDATSGAADSFDPNATNTVNTIAVPADGKILVGGDFSGANSIGGAARNRIARLDATSGAADSFDPNANGAVDAIVVQPDGKILVGGEFSGANSIGGATRNLIARLEATGSADSLNPNATGTVVNTIALQADGKILAGGDFNIVNAKPRNRIARLDATTGSPDAFNPNANGDVRSIAVQADGKILVGGDFNGVSSIGGQARDFFARLTNPTAALQNLAATKSTITWTRAGSSPQFARVTFEYSTDNVSYAPLGNGVATGNDWTLTDLSFSIGQNFYIRARGHYRTGDTNGSESITELIRNVFISPPTPTSVVSLKTHGTAGDFKIDLPLTGNPGIECRKGQGANSDQHQVVFTFAVPITLSGSPTVSVSAPAGGTPGATAGVNGSVVTVDLTGILNAQTITIALTNVNDSGPVSVPMGVLVGDVNADSFVLSGDYTAVRQRSGATVDATTCQYDINVDGFILSGDYTTARQQSGSHLGTYVDPVPTSRSRNR